MKILGVGTQRTGTRSLVQALKVLGFDAVHNPSDPETQRQLRAGDYNLQVLRDRAGAADMPIAVAFPEILAHFPDARVILTVRDVDGWLDSVKRLHERLRRLNLYNYYAWIHDFFYGVSVLNEPRYRRVFAEHAERVQRLTPASQLLVMDLTKGDGWDKLCPFVGRPVPPVAFPRVSDPKH